MSENFPKPEKNREELTEPTKQALIDQIDRLVAPKQYQAVFELWPILEGEHHHDEIWIFNQTNENFKLKEKDEKYRFFYKMLDVPYVFNGQLLESVSVWKTFAVHSSGIEVETTIYGTNEQVIISNQLKKFIGRKTEELSEAEKKECVMLSVQEREIIKKYTTTEWASESLIKDATELFLFLESDEDGTRCPNTDEFRMAIRDFKKKIFPGLLQDDDELFDPTYSPN